MFLFTVSRPAHVQTERGKADILSFCYDNTLLTSFLCEVVICHVQAAIQHFQDAVTFFLTLC